MIKAFINDENRKASVEVKGTPREIISDYAFLGDQIAKSFLKNGISKEDTEMLLAAGYSAIIDKDIREIKIDDEEESSDEAYELQQGDHFFYNGIEFVLLDTTEQGDYFAIVADELPERPFNEQGDDGSNNWAISDLREYLNGEYLDDNFNRDHLVLSTANLTADNGDDAYGTCDDPIIILSCEQYRKYRKVLPHYDNYIWTCTPWSCTVGHAVNVRIVYPSGIIGYDHASLSNGVAPACTFNHLRLNVRRQAHNGHIILAESED